MINVFIASLLLIVFTIIWRRLTVWIAVTYESLAGIIIIFVSGGGIWLLLLGNLMMCINPA